MCLCNHLHFEEFSWGNRIAFKEVKYNSYKEKNYGGFDKNKYCWGLVDVNEGN